MRRIRTTRQFERDLERMRKRGRKLDKLWAVVDALGQGKALAGRLRRHRLSGAWNRFWECHLEPDWLLIWNEDENAVTLARTGSHADLFG